MLLDQDLHNQMEVCSCHMSRIIHKQDDAPTDFIEEFEESLTRTMSVEWIRLAEKAVEAGMGAYSGQTSEAQAKRVERAVNEVMGQYGGAGLQSTLNDQLAIFYEEVTTRFIKEFDLVKVEKAEVTDVGISFSQKDIEAINATQRITAQSAGRYFPDKVQGKTSEVIRQVVLESGLPAEEAAIRLQAELEGALGVQEAAQTVPTRFAANPQAYFNIVARNSSVQATSTGRMISMADAGVEKYRVEAIIDKRTSNICVKLNGREFSVKKSMQAVDSFLEVSSLNDLENLMPFSKNDTVPKWAEEGLGFPPYHHSCRTTVVPTGF